jgi:hypothetical protein
MKAAASTRELTGHTGIPHKGFRQTRKLKFMGTIMILTFSSDILHRLGTGTAQ